MKFLVKSTATERVVFPCKNDLSETNVKTTRMRSAK